MQIDWPMARKWGLRALPVIVMLGALYIFSLSTFDEITLSGNETSRMTLVDSLGDRGVFEIDDSRFSTVDKGRIDGKFYSDKPMFYTLFLTAVYGVCRLLGASFGNSYHDVMYTLNFCGSAIFALGIMLLTFRHLISNSSTERGRAAILSGLGIFGTWLFSYGGIINNHVPAAMFLLLLYILLENWSRHGGEWRLGLAGLCAGILINLEIPTGFFFTVAGGLFLLSYPGHGKLMRTLRFGMFFLIPVGFIGVVDLVAYGSPLPVYLVAGAYDFPGNIHSSGVAGLNRPVSLVSYFFNMLIGYRGFFSHMPVMLLLFPALIKRRHEMEKSPLLFFVGAVLICFCFYGLSTGDYGGWAYGFRFLIPLIPLFWLWISVWIMNGAGKVWVCLFTVLTLIGVITSLIGAYNPWPVVYPREKANLRNCVKLNLYCAAFEYANGSAIHRLAGQMVDDVDMKLYLPRAFMNMRKLAGENPTEWPVVLKTRHTVAGQILDVMLHSWHFLAPLAGGLIFLALMIAITTRILPWFMNADPMWLGPGRIVMLFIPLMLLWTVILVMGCGLGGGGLWSVSLIVGAVLCYLPICMIPRRRIIWRPLQLRGWRFPAAVMLLPSLMGSLLFAASLQVPPWSWDVLTYHLYIPARWLQTQEFIPVATVFGDNAAAYAPKNWFMLATSWLVLLPGDAVLELLSLPFLLFAAVTMALLVKKCGGNLAASNWAGIFVFFTPILFEHGLYEQPDIIAAALLPAALYQLLQYRDNEERSSLILATVYCGLAVGMKTAILPFAVLPLVVLAGMVIGKKQWINMVIAGGAFLLAGGGWYFYNWYCFGNPFFPLDVSIGGIRIFDGAYGAEAVRQGEFHATSLSHLLERIYAQFGSVTSFLALVGWFGWFFVGQNGPQRRGRLLVGIHACGWFFLYIWVIPHNLETRFLFPCLLLLLGGAALLLNRIHRWLPAAGSLTLGISLMIFARERIVLLTDGVHVLTAVTGLLFSAAIIAGLYACWQRDGRRTLMAAAFALLLLAVLVCFSCNVALAGRAAFYARLTGVDGVAWFNHGGNLPMKVAYSGFNRPYVLVGPELANEVFYCNVRGGMDDGLYDFWRKDKPRFNYHKPLLGRDNPQFELWMKNLYASGAQILVLMRMASAEQRYIPHTESGFPLPETHWTDTHPERFTRLSSSPRCMIYSIKNP